MGSQNPAAGTADERLSRSKLRSAETSGVYQMVDVAQCTERTAKYAVLSHAVCQMKAPRVTT